MAGEKNKYIVGIDEVGRGPLAGPVTIGIVMCEEKMYTKLKQDKNLPLLGKDSKKLSAELREKYSKYLKRLDVHYIVLHTSNKEIDKIGIAKCIRKSIQKGLNKLIQGMPLDDIKIVLDGGLRAPSEFIKQKTIIKGDEKERIIAWASILAKVSRDALMVRCAKKFPEYSFDLHKGYGTLAHRNAISRHGLSSLHRKSFCKNVELKASWNCLFGTSRKPV